MTALAGVRRAPLEPGSPEWLATISASQIPVVVGISPFESAHELWHRKAGTTPADIEVTDAMIRGHELEPLIVAHLADAHPDWNIEYPGGSWQHPAHSWATANPDAILNTETLIEVKSVSPGAVIGWREGPPAYVLAQVQWQLLVTGAEQAVIAMSSGWEIFARRPKEFVVMADKAAQRWLLSEASMFQDSLELGFEPSPDYAQEGDRNVLRFRYPEVVKEEGPGLEIPADIAVPFLETLRESAVADELKDVARARLADFMGNAQKATFAGHTLGTRRRGKSGSPPSFSAAQKLAEKTPQILADHYYPLETTA